MERHLTWLAFPGLFKYLVLLGGVVFLAQGIQPGIAWMLSFNSKAIMGGEVWRAVTFVFAPSGLMEFNVIGFLFTFIGIQLGILFSDSLEAVWGPVRMTLYLLASWLALVVVQSVLPGLGHPVAASFMHLSVFLAFAAHFPQYELRVLFFIPVQVRFLALLASVVLAFNMARSLPLALLALPALLPFFIWVLPAVIRGKAAQADAMTRQARFQKDQIPAEEAFHRCEVCGETEKTSPDLDFRTFPDGREYCTRHLPDRKAP